MIKSRNQRFRDHDSALLCWVTVHVLSHAAASVPHQPSQLPFVQARFCARSFCSKLKVEKVTEDAPVSRVTQKGLPGGKGQFDNPFCPSSQTNIVSLHSKSSFFKGRYLWGVLKLESRTLAQIMQHTLLRIPSPPIWQGKCYLAFVSKLSTSHWCIKQGLQMILSWLEIPNFQSA